MSATRSTSILSSLTALGEDVPAEPVAVGVLLQVHEVRVRRIDLERVAQHLGL